MATLNFLYRSKKDNATLNVRLLYRHEDQDYVFGAKTRIEVSKRYWDNYHNQKSPKGIEVRNMQTSVRTDINKIENHILSAFNKERVANINKNWLVEQINLYYNPDRGAVELPNNFLPYFDFYLEEKTKDIAIQTIKNHAVVRKLFSRYESSIKRTIKISAIDVAFKKSFEEYCTEKGYAPNTIVRALQTIKAVCNHAKSNGVKTSLQLDRIKAKETKVHNIYLTPDELTRIEKLDDGKLGESLSNARDWLIISCYTGQRVSDFMRFKKELIREEKETSLIEFTQKKTGKIMTVPLHEKVLEILAKRGGEFPRAISSQNYNSFIKKVCKEAEINEEVKGGKLAKTELDSKFPYRKESGIFKKWELVTSHIGRRSFATNFYSEMPTTYIMYMTGHSTEAMLLKYIGKSNKDLAFEITKYF